MKVVMSDLDYFSHLELSSGRRLEPHLGIIGITPTSADQTGYGSKLFEGFDGTLDDEVDALTQAERVELGNFMIEQWTAWRDAAKSN